MKIENRNGIYLLTYINRHGKSVYSNIDYLKHVEGWRALAEHVILFNSGKRSVTIASWLSRFNSTLMPTIQAAEIKSLPTTSYEWQLLIKNLYANTLVTTHIKANINTRVRLWNSNTKPFLLYLQQRDYIPMDVLIPSMKRVGQISSNSSFNVKLIGEQKPQKIAKKITITKLLSPIILSRTDSDYLDEVSYDLELKRNRLHGCLLKYWLTIKSHFDYAEKLVKSVDNKKYDDRIKTKNFNNIYLTETGAPPRRIHFSGEKNKESFGYLLKSISKRKKPFFLHVCDNEERIPCRNTIKDNENYYDLLLPKLQIENKDSTTISTRLNWCMGLLTPRCISFLIALLMMENPSFTYESLLFCNVKDRDGKYLLELGETGHSFTIEKHRAKKNIKSNLSDLSKKILLHLINITERYSKSIDKTVENKLFYCIKNNQSLTLPASRNTSYYLSGNRDAQEGEGDFIYKIYPSLQKYGLSKSSITHSKIRNTEGVLEFFRSGSIKAVSRKLGNSKKVALEHYLPKVLIAAYNTRLVRRFQNLLIVAATFKEEYMLEATDFNNIVELNNFILDMMSMDSKNTNPLLSFITSENSNVKSGELITTISEPALALLHAYRIVAEESNIDGYTLAKKDLNTGISALSIIQLSKHINQVLSNHNDMSYVQINNLAMNKAKVISKKVGWGELMLNKRKLS